jgi:hypothetical protein
MIYIYIYI